jgi:hypothetical protein
MAAEGEQDTMDFTGNFDVKKLNQHLSICLRNNNNKSGVGSGEDVPDAKVEQGQGEVGEDAVEVVMDEYIQIFHQLYKFFCMLGTVFSFVGSDVKSKLEILQEFRNGPNRDSYETVEKMLAFEKSTGYLEENKEASGSRTFLRLHRALVFVSQFLDKTLYIKDDEGTYHICKESYKGTLAKFHPWIIQKGATLAMYALPTKKELFKRVCDGNIEYEEVDALLLQAIKNTQQIYDQCEKMYNFHGLSDLP